MRKLQLDTQMIFQLMANPLMFKAHVVDPLVFDPLMFDPLMFKALVVDPLMFEAPKVCFAGGGPDVVDPVMVASLKKAFDVVSS